MIVLQRTPDRSQQSYRHEAYLWDTPAEFTDTLAAFVDDGLERGEPVMVALTAEHTRWLQEALGREAAQKVTFVKMAELGRNPARIIPAWRDFVAAADGEPARPARPVRGIGEPIWPGRHAEELRECQLHEALLNVAIHPDTPLWLICPYDRQALAPEVVEEAYRSHPVIIEGGAHRGSAHYAGRDHVEALFGSDLAAPREDARRAIFSEHTLPRLPAYATLELYIAGLSADRAAELGDVAARLAAGSLHRGAVEVVISIWSDREAVVCEVADTGPATDLLYGRRLTVDEHKGLWEANQVCDLVQLRSTSNGTTIRIYSWR